MTEPDLPDLENESMALIRASIWSPGSPVISALHVVPGTLGSAAGAVAVVQVAGHVISPSERVWYWNPSRTTAAGCGYSHETVACP